MAELRRVPFVSLSPVKPREVAGGGGCGSSSGGGPALEKREAEQQQREEQQQQQHESTSQWPQPPQQPEEQQQQREPGGQRPQREDQQQPHTQQPPQREPGARKADAPQTQRETVRLELSLKDSTEESCAEFCYPDLLLCGERGLAVLPFSQTHPPYLAQKKPLNSEDPFNDEVRERKEMEIEAKKFEAKYGGKSHRHRKDRLQDLIDIGYGYDETDPFIDNSEAYDELVPASLTTKYGGFYINTGTLQFRQASDSEDEGFAGNKKHKSAKVSKLKEGEERAMKKRKRKEEGTEREKKPRKMKVPKQLGVMAFNVHKSEKKKKKLYKDSLSLAAMLRKFQKEKEALKKKENRQNPPVVTVITTTQKPPSAPGNDMADLNLGSDPVLSIFGSTSERELFQEAESTLEMLADIDFDQFLDASNGSPLSEPGENGSAMQPNSISQVLIPKQVPALPEGLSPSLEKRVGDLRTDDRLREPLQKLKLAVSTVMPDQLSRYQDDCQAHNQAKNAKLQADEEREKNGSEDDDDEKPGKRVMGPRKKFCWDETVRALLCNLVTIKLRCYELEPSKSHSVEDYLKAFLETEVKPLWPKGWMQARMLFKESRSAHSHLTAASAKKKVILAPKPKVKESSPKKEQRTSTPSVTLIRIPASNSITPTTSAPSSNSTPGPETICVDDSLDEDLSFNPPSLDSVSEALAVINNGSKGPSVSSSLDTPTSRPRTTLREEKLATIMSKLPLSTPKKEQSPTPHSSSLIAGHTGLIPKKPQDLAAQVAITSGLIAGSSIQNPKVSLEPLPAKLLQQGLQRSLQAQVSSTSSQSQAAAASSQIKSSSQTHISSSSSQSHMTKVQQTSVQQNYVSPLQATISKSHTNPVVRLTSSPQLSSSSAILKTPEKQPVYHHVSSSSSTGSSSQASHSLVSRTSSPSTSSNYLAKGMGSQVSSTGFKPPYSVIPSTKSTISPSSSNSSISVAQSSSHHKPTSGVNINRQSPTMSLSSGRTSGIQTVKNLQPSHKLTSSSTKLASPSPKQANSSTKLITPPPKLASPAPKLATPPSRIASSSPKLVTSSPKITSSPKLVTPSAKLPNPSPKLSSQSSKLSSSSGTVNKNNLSGVGLSVSGNRGNLISSGNRTSLPGGTGNGTQGATKPLSTPHRPSSASGSPSAAAIVQTTAGASLLANTSPLTLMTSPLSVTSQNVTSAPLTPFGMLGGLVPVTVPFQFPLELLGFGTDTAGVTTSSGSTSAAFHHSLTQNLLKGLQTSSQHTATLPHSPLPAHLQQAYTEGGQSKGDAKLQRKSQ
ncbi:ubinuclein-2 isoform X2 [Rhinatrema bivittatum]|uniref:ubinuclein-2 isoform X2 n=1 Tax=Rhinatrema bivittatum TaxID=194408 RepID=UPI00112E53CA|nr:ubinuclein-2 isoform X2 [Rhinatrema bivittatum]